MQIFAPFVLGPAFLVIFAAQFWPIVLVYFFVVIVASILGVVYLRGHSTASTPSTDFLTPKEKVLVWFFCLAGPMISWAVLYDGLKEKFPGKAKEVRTISTIAFFIFIFCVLLFGFLIQGALEHIQWG
ncbi:MAG: hypothetical protein ACYC8S_03820 [Minisyncoccota bacterium]